MSNYDVTNWYWVVDGSRSQVYSSAGRDYVAITDQTYMRWLASGNAPSRIVMADLPAVVNQPVIDQIMAIEVKQARTLRDIALGNVQASGTAPMTPLQRLQVFDAEIAQLRATLISSNL